MRIYNTPVPATRPFLQCSTLQEIYISGDIRTSIGTQGAIYSAIRTKIIHAESTAGVHAYFLDI